MTDRGVPSRFESEPEPPEELFTRIRAAIDSTPAARASTRLRVASAMAVVPLASLAVLLIASQLFDRPALRADIGAHSTSQLLIELLLVVGLTFSATLVAGARGAGGLGPGATSLFLVALLVTPIYSMLTLANAKAAGAGAVSLVELSPWGLRCLAIAAAVGLLALISFAAALRRSVPVASRLRGAALGAAAGAWAGLVVFFFCPAAEFRHLLVGHILPIAAFTLLGLAAIPRILRP